MNTQTALFHQYKVTIETVFTDGKVIEHTPYDVRFHRITVAPEQARQWFGKQYPGYMHTVKDAATGEVLGSEWFAVEVEEVHGHLPALFQY